MRILFAAAVVLAFHAPGLRAQGVIGVSAQILPREEMVVGGSATRVERGARGAVRVSLPITLSPGYRPLVTVESAPGAPVCTLAPDARAGEGWSARLSCTVPPGTAPDGAPIPVRLMLTPNA